MFDLPSNTFMTSPTVFIGPTNSTSTVIFTYSYTVPMNATWLYVIMSGGGGGGGGDNGFSPSTNGSGGGGGGGRVSFLLSAQGVTKQLYFNVGSGGAPGSSGNFGTAGSATSLWIGNNSSGARIQVVDCSGGSAGQAGSASGGGGGVFGTMSVLGGLAFYTSATGKAGGNGGTSGTSWTPGAVPTTPDAGNSGGAGSGGVDASGVQQPGVDGGYPSDSLTIPLAFETSSLAFFPGSYPSGGSSVVGSDPNGSPGCGGAGASPDGSTVGGSGGPGYVIIWAF